LPTELTVEVDEALLGQPLAHAVYSPARKKCLAIFDNSLSEKVP